MLEYSEWSKELTQGLFIGVPHPEDLKKLTCITESTGLSWHRLVSRNAKEQRLAPSMIVPCIVKQPTHAPSTLIRYVEIANTHLTVRNNKH